MKIFLPKIMYVLLSYLVLWDWAHHAMGIWMFKSDTFKTLLFAISYCPVVVQGHMYDHVIAQAHTLTTYLVTLRESGTWGTPKCHVPITQTTSTFLSSYQNGSNSQAMLRIWELSIFKKTGYCIICIWKEWKVNLTSNLFKKCCFWTYKCPA